MAAGSRAAMACAMSGMTRSRRSRGRGRTPLPLFEAREGGEADGEVVDGSVVWNSRARQCRGRRDLLEGADDDLGHAGEEKDVKAMRKDEGRRKRP